MKAPCRDCDRRHIGCHTICTEYKAWRREQDKIIEAKAKEEAAKPAFNKNVLRKIYKDMKCK